MPRKVVSRKKAVTKKAAKAPPTRKARRVRSEPKLQAIQAAYNKLRPGQRVLVDALAESFAEKMQLRAGHLVQPFKSKDACIELIGKLGMFLAQAEKATT